MAITQKILIVSAKDDDAENVEKVIVGGDTIVSTF